MRVRRALGVSALLALVGCGLNFDPQPNPTQYYLMSAFPDEPVDGPAVLAGKALGLGPIYVAPYADQQRIATRMEPNRVEFAEFDRWAEPFTRHFERIVGQNLLNLTRPRSSEIFPFYGDVDVRVKMEVWRFDRRPDGSVELEVDWTILDGSGEQILADRDVVIQEPATATGPNGEMRIEDSVLAFSVAVGRLTSEIAAALGDVNLGQ